MICLEDTKTENIAPLAGLPNMKKKKNDDRTKAPGQFDYVSTFQVYFFYLII